MSKYVGAVDSGTTSTRFMLFDPLGGIVAFDEYHDATWVGPTKAVDDFFANRPVCIVKHPLFRYYTVKP